MRKLKHASRHRQRKERSKRAITLALEQLEPRLVLSAVGFGFEATRGQLDSHDRHHGNHEANRPAFAEQFHDKRGDERFEPANRSESDWPSPVRYGHPQGGRPHEPFLANSLELEGNASRSSRDQSGTPRLNFGGAEGESRVPTSEFEDFSSTEFASDIFVPSLLAETTIPSTTVVFIFLTPTTSPARGSDSLSFGQPTTRLTQPPRTFSTDPVSPPSGSAATLPVTVPVSSPATSRSSATATSIESSQIRFDSASSDSDAVSVQPAGESKRIAETEIGSFVSLTSDDLARSWNVDGASFEAAFKTSGPLTASVRPTAATGQTVASLTASADSRGERLSEESLWASVSDGGFIEIDTDVADNTRERFEFVEESEHVSGSERLSTQTPQDGFWFDFGNPRLDLICDSFATEETAEEQALDDADDTAEEAWLLDDGGMIVLTSSQFIDQADEVARADTGESSSMGEAASAETEIPMDAGIGVFQAIEVAAAPVELQDPSLAPDDTPGSIEREAAADADDAVPAAGQAAKNSDSGDSEPVRAASIPLLVAIASFLSRGRENRKKVAYRQRQA